MEATSAVIAIIPVILIVAIVIYVARSTMDNNVDKIKPILGATVGIILVCCVAIPIISGLNGTEPEPEPTPQALVVTVETNVEINAGASYTFTPTANTTGVSYTLTGSGVAIEGLTITGDVPGTYSLNLKATKTGYTESNTPISVSVNSISRTFTLPANADLSYDHILNIFNGCKNIISIEVENGNTDYVSIDGALYRDEIEPNNRVVLVRVPEGYASATFTLPANAIIDDGAFDGCRNITSFAVENGNEKYYAIDGCLYDDSNYLIRVPEGYTSATYTLPANAGVYTFSDPFAGCKNITAIDVAANNSHYFLSIGGCLYDAYYKLVRVPEGYTSATFTLPAINQGVFGDMDPFAGCENITAIAVEEGNNYCYSIDGCLYDNSNYLIRVPEGYASATFTLPASTTGFYYFYNEQTPYFDGCKNITAFAVENGNTDFSAVNGCLYTSDQHQYSPNRLLRVPEGYTSATFTLPANAGLSDYWIPFDGCDNITAFAVENGNTDFSASNGCLYYQSSVLVKVPEGYASATFTLPAINQGVFGYMDPFAGCENITAIAVEEGTNYCYSIDGCLYSVDSYNNILSLIRVPEGY